MTGFRIAVPQTDAMVAGSDDIVAMHVADDADAPSDIAVPRCRVLLILGEKELAPRRSSVATRTRGAVRTVARSNAPARNAHARKAPNATRLDRAQVTMRSRRRALLRAVKDSLEHRHGARCVGGCKKQEGFCEDCRDQEVLPGESG